MNAGPSASHLTLLFLPVSIVFALVYLGLLDFPRLTRNHSKVKSSKFTKSPTDLEQSKQIRGLKVHLKQIYLTSIPSLVIYTRPQNKSIHTQAHFQVNLKTATKINKSTP